MLKINYIKRSINVSLPITLSQVVNTLNTFVSTLMLATLGHNVLAATALLFAVPTSIMVILMSWLFTTSVLVSRLFGQGKRSEIGNLIQQIWLFALCLSGITMLIFWYIKPLLLFFHQKEQLIDIILPYFHIAMWGLPALFVNVVSNQLCYGANKARYGTYSSIVNVATTLSMAYIFIFGKFGAPACGVAGWGIAAATGYWVSAIFLNSLLFIDTDIKQLHIFKRHMHGGLTYIKQMIKIGWPLSIQTGAELLSLFFIIIMVGWMTKVDLAAMQISQQYILFILIPVFGFTSAAGVLVGHAHGSKQIDDIKDLAFTNLFLGISFVVVIGTIILLFHHYFFGIFLSHNETDAHVILKLAFAVFLIRLIGLFFDGIRNILTGSLRGLLDVKYAMIISVCSIWLIRMPLSYFFGFTMSWGVIGISISNIVAMLLGSIFLYYRWKQQLKHLTWKTQP